MGSSYEEKVWRNKYKVVPAMSASIAEEGIKRKQSFERPQSADTILRTELQLNIIKPLAEEGLSVLEIVKILEAMDKYQSLSRYFQSYAENQVNKVRKAQKKRKEQDKER